MAHQFDILTMMFPKTGRRVRENKDLWNEADWGFLLDLINPTAAVFRERGFFWSDLREDVATSNVYYYSFTFSDTKHTVIYTRDLSAGEGPVRLDNIVGATYTPGSADPPINLFAGKPASDLVVTNGATGVSGGTTIPVDYLFSTGNKSAVAGASGLPTIFPPGAEVLLKVTNESAGVNPGIKLALAFVEVEIPGDLI